jgi:hypothetical protein
MLRKSNTCRLPLEEVLWTFPLYPTSGAEVIAIKRTSPYVNPVPPGVGGPYRVVGEKVNEQGLREQSWCSSEPGVGWRPVRDSTGHRNDE